MPQRMLRYPPKGVLAWILSNFLGMFEVQPRHLPRGASFMTFSIKPDSHQQGAMCTAHLQFNGAVPPLPNDVHIDAKHDDGSWHAVVGYDTIPANKNPLAGFDIRFSGGNPNVGGPGNRRFRVRWTLNGETIGKPEEIDVILGQKPEVPLSEPDSGTFFDYVLQAIKSVFIPLTLPGCLLCRMVADTDGACALFCAALPLWLKRALGIK